MARSTGIVVTAGALAGGNMILTKYEPAKLVTIAVGTVLAALAAAGLDHVIPGFGTGTAVVLLVAVIMRDGPSIVDAIRGGK